MTNTEGGIEIMSAVLCPRFPHTVCLVLVSRSSQAGSSPGGAGGEGAAGPASDPAADFPDDRCDHSRGEIECPLYQKEGGGDGKKNK